MNWFKEPWKLSLVLVVSIALLWAVPRMQTTLSIFLMAFAIAYLLDPLVDVLEKLKMPRLAAIFILFSLFFVLICIASFIMFPILAAQVRDVAVQFPTYLERIYSTINKWQRIYKTLKVSPTVRDHIENLNIQTVQRIGELMQTFFGGLGTLIVHAVSGVFMFLASVIISMFLLVGLDKMRSHFLNLFPLSYRGEIKSLGQELSRLFGGFLRGQVVLCLMMGIGVGIGFWFLRVFYLPFEYSLLISIMAGIGYAVPYIGSIVPMILGAFLGYFQTNGWQLPLWVTLMQLIIYQIVNNFAVPIVMGKEVGVSPIFIIFAIFAGGELFGFWGLILSVPIAAAMRVIVLYAIRKWRDTAQLPA